jgi:hypothetical protein
MSLIAGFGLLIACTNNNGDSDAVDGGGDATVPQCTMGPFGGAVSGAMDMHCMDDAGAIVQPTDQASCHPPADAAPPPDDGGMDDGGMKALYGPTMFNSEGDDDDCKYHVKWSATPVCRNGGVTFTITVTKKADGKPATGANPYTESVLLPAHVAAGSPTTNETMPGVYTIGPIIFDQPGKWFVRFHLYGDCDDTLDTSPHGHAAFFVNVP